MVLGHVRSTREPEPQMDRTVRVVRAGPAEGGCPILLVHGFTGCAEAWGERILDALARRRRVLAVDLPGHGESDSPGDASRYRMERVVADLVQVIESEGASRADWVGYSMGGRIVVAAAALHAARVRKVVVESGSPGLEDPRERARRRGADEELARGIEGAGLERFVDSWMRQPLFTSQRRLPESVRERARQLRLQHRPDALAAVLRGLGTGSQPSFWGDLRSLTAEALLLTGAWDEKFERVARRMAQRLPNCDHHTVPRTGHAVHLENPEAWLAAVAPFLEAG